MMLNSIEAGTGDAFVLLHGLFGAGKNLGVIARGIAGLGRVISLDMRNHGESGHDKDMRYAAMARDVAETLAALDVGAASLIGHSMGGKVAMFLALTRPELVRRLVVLDIAPVKYGHGHEAHVAGMKAVPLAPGFSRARADAVLADYVPEADLRAFLLSNFLPGAAPRWRLGLDEIAGAMADLVGWEAPAGATPYEGEAVFIRGEKSDYVRDAGLEAVKKWFPRAGVKTIAGAGHWLHAEQPAAVVAAIKGFLADE